jgi:hypothetical protein
MQPGSVIQSDFDRLAAVDEDNWNHNNHYHVILDLYEAQGWRESHDAGLAMIGSLALRLLHNGRFRESAAVRQAWAAHGAHDAYLRLAQVRDICSKLLPGAIVTRHLFWRYSIVWQKPR